MSRTRPISIGDTVPARTLTSIHGTPTPVPDPTGLVHLQLRRFAGCPICNVHLNQITQRHDEILAAGIREVVVFHSSVEVMLPYQAELPFDAVADPDRLLYGEFGARESIRALGSLRAVRASLRGIPRAVRAGGLRGAVGVGERHLGQPAEFLIEPGGRVRDRKYGVHAYDQWSVDELLQRARAGSAS
ncbi:MAG TPA: peroxiredoxin-like family protein [Pseudonocardia sp.]|jgi:peroxiredoxin|nr:peroxiredoxin-like family protein [Pseudonocardia sp.]